MSLPATFPVLHGRRRTDDYAWLKDENWQQEMRDPAALRADIREYLEAENAYKDAVLAPTETLRVALFDEFRGRIREDDASVPAKDGAWEYYHRYREGGQHPVVCRRPAGDAAGEQNLLDGDAEAEGKSYYRIGGRGHAWNHRRFAWSVDENGSEYFTLRVKDLDTGKELGDAIERCSGGFVWAADHETLFYTLLDDNHRPCKVLRHRVGTTRLSLVDRGFVYAIAHVRGGTERGYAWYTGGKLRKKTNTFHDFIAAARALAERGFTRPGRIAIHGGSAGGLLVGACTNMAPELFHDCTHGVKFVTVPGGSAGTRDD